MKRKRYDDKFRASAVIMLEAQGYPEKEGALLSVANHLGVPSPTLYRWFTGKQNPPNYELVTEKRIDFLAAIESEMAGILGDMPNARKDANYRDLGVVLGILAEKKQLLEGKATQITDNRNMNVNANLEVESHDAGNILKQLAELGAIPPARSEGDNDPAPE